MIRVSVEKDSVLLGTDTLLGDEQDARADSEHTARYVEDGGTDAAGARQLRAGEVLNLGRGDAIIGVIGDDTGRSISSGVKRGSAGAICVNLDRLTSIEPVVSLRSLGLLEVVSSFCQTLDGYVARFDDLGGLAGNSYAVDSVTLLDNTYAFLPFAVPSLKRFGADMPSAYLMRYSVFPSLLITFSASLAKPNVQKRKLSFFAP